jgi:hypothetical protein
MKRLPAKQDLTSAFLTIITIVNFWALIVFLYNFPGLIKQLPIKDIFSVLAYVLFSALVESSMIFIGLVLLSAILPARFLRENFRVRAALLLLLSTIYIIPFQVNIPRLSTLMLEAEVSIFIAMWTVLYAAELILFHLIIPRYPNFTARVSAIIDRVIVLGAVYLFLDLIGSGLVVLANWS